MPNFMEQLSYQKSQKAIDASKRANAKAKGDYIINGCLDAIKRSVTEHYSERSIEGYIGGNTGYDDIHHEIIPESSRTSEYRKTNGDLLHIEDDPYIIDYVKEMLPQKITELGLTVFHLEYYWVEGYTRNNRDLLSWNKYRKTGYNSYIIKIKLQW